MYARPFQYAGTKTITWQCASFTFIAFYFRLGTFDISDVPRLIAELTKKLPIFDQFPAHLFPRTKILILTWSPLICMPCIQSYSAAHTHTHFLLGNFLVQRSFRVSVYLWNFSVFPFGICWRVHGLFSTSLYYSIVVCPILARAHQHMCTRFKLNSLLVVVQGMHVCVCVLACWWL